MVKRVIGVRDKERVEECRWQRRLVGIDKAARKVADRLALKVGNDRMLGYQGPAQPSPTIGDALNAGYGYLEVRCLGCYTHQTVALDIVRRPKTTPIHELERRCGLSATRCFWRAVVFG